jgi:hypothetical protein
MGVDAAATFPICEADWLSQEIAASITQCPPPVLTPMAHANLGGGGPGGLFLGFCMAARFETAACPSPVSPWPKPTYWRWTREIDPTDDVIDRDR